MARRLEKQLKGLPRAKPGTKFLVIATSKPGKFIVNKLRRR